MSIMHRCRPRHETKSGSLQTHVPSLKISQTRIPNDQMSVGTVHVADVRVSGAIHLSKAATV